MSIESSPSERIGPSLSDESESITVTTDASFVTSGVLQRIFDYQSSPQQQPTRQPQDEAKQPENQDKEESSTPPEEKQKEEEEEEGKQEKNKEEKQNQPRSEGDEGQGEGESEKEGESQSKGEGETEQSQGQDKSDEEGKGQGRGKGESESKDKQSEGEGEGAGENQGKQPGKTAQPQPGKGKGKGAPQPQAQAEPGEDESESATQPPPQAQQAGGEQTGDKPGEDEAGKGEKPRPQATKPSSASQTKPAASETLEKVLKGPPAKQPPQEKEAEGETQKAEGAASRHGGNAFSKPRKKSPKRDRPNQPPTETPDEPLSEQEIAKRREELAAMIRANMPKRSEIKTEKNTGQDISEPDDGDEIEEGTHRTKNEYKGLIEKYVEAGASSKAEAGEIIRLIDRVKNMTNRSRDNIYQELVAEFKKIVEKRKIIKTVVRDDLPRSQAEFLDDPVQHRLEKRAGVKDPHGWAKEQQGEEEDFEYGGFEAVLIYDKSDSTNEDLEDRQYDSKGITIKKKDRLQEAAYLFLEAMHWFSNEVKETNQRTRASLAPSDFNVKSRLTTYQGEGSYVNAPIVKKPEAEYDDKLRVSIYKNLKRDIGGGTPDYVALERMIEELRKDPVKLKKIRDKKLLMFVVNISDGESNEPELYAAAKKELQKKYNIVVVEIRQVPKTLCETISKQLIKEVQKLYTKKIKHRTN